MNNLKRVLSLGLVGAMLSGMMIMGAGAATYTDVDDIENIEAVEVMGSLNIINGKDDGTFSPEESVTRSQMAKMIAVAMNGGKEPNFGVKANPTFTDTKGHWAETFIEYCYDMKIINGRGDGTFDPDGNVTGVEAAKMVLSALGYEATAYQLTGAEWDSNVNKNATQVCKPSLYDTLENVVMSQPINRDTAAQIIWNGLQNKTVTVNPDTVVSSGEVTNRYNNDGPQFLEVHYGATIGFGILSGNDKTDTGLNKGHIKLTSFILDDADESVAANYSTVNFPWDTDLSLIGEKVKVIFKDGKQGTKNKPDKNDTIYGVFNANETEVVTGKMSDVKNVESTDRVINIGGTEYDLATSVSVIFNYASDRTTPYNVNVDAQGNFTTDPSKNQTATKESDGSWTQSKLTQALKKTRGDTIKAVMNDDNKVNRIYVTESVLSYVTAVSSDKVTINGIGTLKKADHDIYDGIAKDDMVTVTTLYKSTPTNDDAYNIVAKAEVVTGEIDKFKNTDSDKNETITVDGTVYKVYNKADFTVKNGSKFLDAVASSNIGKEVELYMVNGYVAAAKLISDDASNYSVITAISTTSAGVGDIFDSLRVQVQGADGTKTKLELDGDSKLLDGSKVKDATASTAATITKPAAKYGLHVGDIVTYDMNKDGTATIYVKGEAVKGTDVGAYSKDTKSVTVDGHTYVSAADCVLFVHDTDADKDRVYTLRNMGKITNGSVASVAVKDGKAVAAFLTLPGTPSGAASTKVFGMVSGKNGTVKIDGSYYRQFTISVNGEEYVVNQRESKWLENPVLAVGNIVGFEPTSDGLYENTNDFKAVVDGTVQDSQTPVAVWVKEYDPSEGIITVFTGQDSTTVNGTTTYKGTGAKTYAVDDDVKMYYVDTDGDTAMEAGSVSTMNTMTGYKSAYLVLETTGDQQKVVAIIAEVSGEADVEERN